MNSFLLNAPTARKSFSPLYKAINTTAVLPILECLLISGRKDGMTFTACDLENTFTYKTKDKPVEGEFTTCLSGKSIRHLLNNSIDPVLSVKMDKGMSKATVSSGGFSLCVELQNPDNFPKSPILSEINKSITIDAKDIYESMANSLKFISNDNLRPAMTGVCFTDWEGFLHLVSTDAHRLIYLPIMKTPHKMKGIGVIIPRKAVELFIMSFKSGPVTISVYEQYISFESSEYKLVSRLIDAKYPDFSKVIIAPDIDFCMQRKQLMSFIKIAIPFVDTLTKRISLFVNKDSITIHGGDIDFGNELNYKLPIYMISKEFLPFKFALNIKFLLDACTVKKDEYVKISHTTLPFKGMIIDDCAMVMPLMMNDTD